MPLVLSAPEGTAAHRAATEVARVRHLHRRSPVPLVTADVMTGEGAEAAVQGAVDRLGSLDAVLTVVPTEALKASAAPEQEVMPLIWPAVAALERRVGGRLVLAVDVPRRDQSDAVDAAFTALVQHLARRYYARGLCVNGVLVAAEPPPAEQLRAFESGSRADAARDALLSAAAGASELLLTFAGASLTGQVLRIGRPPALRPEPVSAHASAGSRPPLPSPAR